MWGFLPVLLYDLGQEDRLRRVIGMAVKSTGSTESKTAAAAAQSDDTTAAAGDGRPKVASDCVVDADFHVGRAVNGKVCSYHAMHYAADGSRRQ
jgi:hypothetical protein